jgi:hypothetical protein
MLPSKKAGIRFKLVIGHYTLRGDNSLIPAVGLCTNSQKKKEAKKKIYSNSIIEQKCMEQI